MKTIFARLAQTLQGNAECLAELQRIQEAFEAGVNQVDDVQGFVKRLRFAGALDAATAGSLEIDLLFVAPIEAKPETSKEPLYHQNSMLGRTGHWTRRDGLATGADHQGFAATGYN